MTATDTASASNFHWRSGRVKSVDSVRSWQPTVAWSRKTSEVCELRSCRLAATKCSRCCTTSTSLMTLRCPSTRTVHQAGLTPLTTRSSTTAWFHHARQRAILVCGKFPWWCGKIWTAVDARWVTPAQTPLTPMAFTRWSWRTLRDITPPVVHPSDFTTTLLGSHNHITKKVSSTSSMLSTLWTMSSLSQIGKHCNGSEIQHLYPEWIRSSHSNATIKWVEIKFWS